MGYYNVPPKDPPEIPGRCLICEAWDEEAECCPLHECRFAEDADDRGDRRHHEAKEEAALRR